MRLTIELRLRRFPWILFLLCLALSLLSVADDLLERVSGPASQAMEPLLRSEAESSLARWYFTLLMFLCSGAAAATAQRAGQGPQPRTGGKLAWGSIAVVFLLLSAAKITSAKSVVMHLAGSALRLAGLSVPRTVAAAALLAILAITYLPFLASLERRTTRRLLAAAAVYLGGAVILDVGTSLLWHAAGESSLEYATASTLEELVEGTGAILFLRAVLGHLAWYGIEQTAHNERNPP